LWQSIVNVDHIKAAVQKLKEINWLYADVDDCSIDDASRRVIECVNDACSTMLVRATAEDVNSFQAYTIRRLDQKQSTMADTEHYKLIENAMSNKLKHLDVLCFPTLFSRGRFGEAHERSVSISSSEYAKLRLLNRDSRFQRLSVRILSPLAEGDA